MSHRRQLVLGAAAVAVLAMLGTLAWLVRGRWWTTTTTTTTATERAAARGTTMQPSFASPSLAATERDEAKFVSETCDAMFSNKRACDALDDRIRRCFRGDDQACDDVGAALWAKGSAFAMNPWLKACHRGHQPACAAIERYRRWYMTYGLPRSQDLVLASEVANACRDKDMAACNAIGMHDPDSDAGRAAYEQACDAGVSDACLALANFAPTAVDRVRVLQHECDDLQLSRACWQLGVLYAGCDFQCDRDDPLTSLVRDAGIESHPAVAHAFSMYGSLANASTRAFGDVCAAPCPEPDAALAAFYAQRACELCECSTYCGPSP